MPMLTRQWHYFRPQTLTPVVARHTSDVTHDLLFARAEAEAERTLAVHRTIDEAITTLKHRVGNASTPERLLALTLLMVPQAARAQAMMDAHRNNFHDRKSRLFELIDFNDTFVATVLALTPAERHEFIEHLRHAMQHFAKKHKTPMFKDGQFDAIVHGLSREIAVYHAALREGFDALMTSRTDDAFGVDIQVRDRQTRAYVNIDIKTHSSYYFRLKVLLRERRISMDEANVALETGYCQVMNRKDSIDVPVIVFRIDHTILGDITDFEFTSSERIGEKLQLVLDECGIHDDGYGKSIVPL
ncbi:MAG TPA: hypothetical protein VFQ70_02330 [Candidatus Saccharimonadaceae bacterium]|nr:hypothetical protein [Candidatus Saccharimonadaceae bacterium]